MSDNIYDEQLPDGLRVRFEYGLTVHAPSGRIITHKDGSPALRRYARAHLFRTVTTTDGTPMRVPIASGTAVFNPADKAYVKRVGRELALERALERAL
jgi:hypothetical protein